MSLGGLRITRWWVRMTRCRADGLHTARCHSQQRMGVRATALVTCDLERARRAVTDEESCWKKTITSGLSITHALYSTNEMIPSCGAVSGGADEMTIPSRRQAVAPLPDDGTPGDRRRRRPKELTDVTTTRDYHTRLRHVTSPAAPPCDSTCLRHVNTSRDTSVATCSKSALAKNSSQTARTASGSARKRWYAFRSIS